MVVHQCKDENIIEPPRSKIKERKVRDMFDEESVEEVEVAVEKHKTEKCELLR